MSQVGAVETEDGKTDRGSAGVREGSNVIRFPGDWIGPREELIPIAAASSPSESGALAPDRDSTGPARPGAPLAPDRDSPRPAGSKAPLPPDAFWSENSDEIQSVLLAPQSPGAFAERQRTGPRNRRLRRILGLPRAATAWRGAAAMAIALGCGIAVMLLLAFAGGSRLLAPSVTATALHPGASDLQGDIASLAAVRPRHADAAPRAGVTRSVKPAPLRPRGQTRHASHGSNGTPVSDTVRAASGAGQGSEPSRAGPAAVTTAGTNIRSAPASGPVGAGAPFGPGSLG